MNLKGLENRGGEKRQKERENSALIFLLKIHYFSSLAHAWGWIYSKNN